MRLFSRSRYLSLTLLVAMVAMLITACGDSSPTPASSSATTTTSNSSSTPTNATTVKAQAAPSPSPTTLVQTVGNTNAKVVLNYMVWGGDTGFSRRFKNMQTIFPEFNDYGLKLLVPGSNDSDVASALRLALTAGKDIPDIVQLNRTQLAEFALSGELSDLTDTVTPFKSDLYEGALNVATYDNKIYAFPQEAKSKVFYYRADLFEQAGINVANIKTLADYISAGKQLNAKFPNSYIINLGPEVWSGWLGMLLSAYPNANFADTNGNYQLTKNPAFAESFKLLKDLKDAGIALPIDDWSNDWKQAYKDGKIAATLSANWMAYFLPQFAPDQVGKWKVAPWPSGLTSVDQSLGSEGGGSITVVPKRAPHSKEAIQYLSKLFFDKKPTVSDYQAGGLTPLIRSAQPDIQSYISTAKKPDNVTADAWAQTPFLYFGPDYQGKIFTLYDSVRVFNYDPSASKEFDILNQWLRKYLSGQVPLNDALAKAQADMEGQIGNPYQK